MAVNATFKADFSSFYDAVQKADASMAVFNGDVMKVEKSLNKMIDEFSGQKVANEAALMTRAIGELGGASTLTEKEMQRVNGVLTEAIAKCDALGEQAPGI
jgi:truncated hemoglobin YjbI